MSQKIKTGTLYITERPDVKVLGTGPDGEVKERYTSDFKGDPGTPAAEIVSADFVGDDIVFTKDDSTTFLLLGAKTSLIGPTGNDGATIISAEFVGDDIVFTLDNETTVTLAGAKLSLVGPQGEPGAAGKGITSITKTSTLGNVDTYTITYSDATTTTFDITNGQDGEGSGDISGSGTANEIAYFTAEKTIDNLPVATYPSLTELSYVKGVSSAIQTQIGGKVTANAGITGATKTKITYDAKGLVTAGEDATTADIAESTNKNYVTDAEKTAIGTIGDKATLANPTFTGIIETPAIKIPTNAGLGKILMSDADGDAAWGDPSSSVPEAGVAVSNGSSWGSSLQAIDPDITVAQSPAQLIGGDDVVLQNFVNLALGTNDGKIKANIDEVEYDNLGIDLYITETNSSNKIEQELSNNTKSLFSDHAQSFNSGNIIQITSIKFKIRSDVSTSNTTTISLRQGIGLSGQVIATVVVQLSQNSTGDKIITATFSSPVNISKNTNYTFTFSGCSNQDNNMYIYYQNSNVYSDGHCWLSGTEQIGYDLYFDIVGKYLNYEVNGIGTLATPLQTAIRTATSKLETVVYNTDHFEITSTVLGKNSTSQVLKLTAPSTGTDISGAGYLDLGANATEIPADGDDYKLVRLDENGNILTSEILSSFKTISSIYTRTSALTERSTQQTAYTKLKEIEFNDVAGTIQVSFDLKSGSSTAGRTAYGRIYKNGVAVGTERSTLSTSYVVYTEDIAVSPGDLIQLYCKQQNASYVAYCQNFKLNYDLKMNVEENVVNTN